MVSTREVTRAISFLLECEFVFCGILGSCVCYFVADEHVRVRRFPLTHAIFASSILRWFFPHFSHCFPFFVRVEFDLANHRLMVDVFIFGSVLDVLSVRVYLVMEFMPRFWFSVFILMSYFLPNLIPMSSVSSLSPAHGFSFSRCGGYFEACHFVFFAWESAVDKKRCGRQRRHSSGHLFTSKSPLCVISFGCFGVFIVPCSSPFWGI